MPPRPLFTSGQELQTWKKLLLRKLYILAIEQFHVLESLVSLQMFEIWYQYHHMRMLKLIWLRILCTSLTIRTSSYIYVHLPPNFD